MTEGRQTLIVVAVWDTASSSPTRNPSRPSRTFQNGCGSNASQGRLKNWPGCQTFRQMGDPRVGIHIYSKRNLVVDRGHRVEVKDISLTDYIQVRHAVYLPHTAGRYAKKQFKKAQMPIVERLVDRCVYALHQKRDEI